MALTRPKYSQIYDTDWKQSVRLATTTDVGNLFLANVQPSTIDSVNLSVNDRILVKDQTRPFENGIYIVRSVGTGSNGWWTRTLDAAQSSFVTSGLSVVVSEGTVNSGREYRLTTPDPITLDSTDLSFLLVAAQPGGANTYVQFNDMNIMNGNPGFTFNKTTNVVAVSGSIQVSNIQTTTANIQSATASTNTATGALRVMGGVGVAGSVYATTIYGNIGGGSILPNVYITGSLIPTANIAYDLGTPTAKFRSAYFSGNTIYIGEQAMSVSPDGTWTFTSQGANIQMGATAPFNAPNATFSDYVSIGGVVYANNTSTSTGTSTGALRVAGGASIVGNLYVGGNLYISGNLITYNTNNLVIDDSIIYLAHNNPGDAVDIGFIGHFIDPGYQHTGFVRDASDGIWKLFANVTTEPTTIVDFTNASYSNIRVGNVIAGTVLAPNYIGTTPEFSGNASAANIIITGAGQFSGQFNEATTTAGVFIGNASSSAPSPRIGFFNGNTSQNWQIDNNYGTFRWFTPGVERMTLDTNGNLRVTGALIAGGTSGVSGYTLQTTGTGIQWAAPTAGAVISSGTSNVAVLSSGGNVVISVGGSIVANVGSSGLTVIGGISAGSITGNGAALTGLPAGYSNVNASTFLASGTLTTAINTTGNILSSGATLSSLTVNGSANVTGFSNITVASGSIDSALVIMGNVSKGGASYHDFLRVTSTTSGIVNPNMYFRLNGLGNLQIINSGYSAQLFELRQNGTVIVSNDILPSANNVSNIGSATSKFNTVHAKATQAQYADLAENYTSDRDYIPGTVVIFGGEREVTVSIESHDPRVAGVVSTNPAYHMNVNTQGVAVALTGRVPTKVKGPISKGDRVVTSDVRGAGERLDVSRYQPGCIIGKALEEINDDSIQVIEVVVGRV